MTQFRKDLEYMVTMITGGDKKRLKPIQFRPTFTDTELLTPISQLGLGQRAYNRLTDNGYTTVADILEVWNGLKAVPKLGKISVEEIKVAVIGLAYERYTEQQRQDFWFKSLVPLAANTGK